MTDEMIALMLAYLVTYFFIYRLPYRGFRFVAAILFIVLGLISMMIVSIYISVLLIIIGFMIVMAVFSETM